LLFESGDKYPFFGVTILDILLALICVVLISTGYVTAPYEKPEKEESVQDGPLFEVVPESQHEEILICSQAAAAADAEEEAYESIRMRSTPL
jgi:hypothetical protein